MGAPDVRLAEDAIAVWPRRERLAVVPPVSDASWKAVAAHAEADPSRELMVVVERALRRQGLRPDGEARLLRHRAGGGGLPDLPATAAFGFLLDLSDARRVLDGGLLLFLDGTGRATGWRAEAGALTLWQADQAPQLTELAPGAPERLSLFGAARPL